MKAFVFKSNSNFIAKFEITSTDLISSAVVNFGKNYTLSDYDYVECSGETWTVINGPQGLELIEGRKHDPKVTKFVENSLQVGQLPNVSSRYKDAYLTARAVSSVGGVIKIVGILLGLGLLFLGLVAGGILGKEIGTFVVISTIIVGTFGGTILYVIGVLIITQGQILKATLDSAIHSSPFLSDDMRLSIMQVKR
jgi:hypothetical protein